MTERLSVDIEALEKVREAGAGQTLQMLQLSAEVDLLRTQFRNAEKVVREQDLTIRELTAELEAVRRDCWAQDDVTGDRVKVG